MKKFIFFAIINLINAFDICVVGGSSGLGKELIYQSLEKNKKVLALTNNPNKVCIPYRGKGLTEIYNKNHLITNSNLMLDKYKNSNKYLFKNIVFTTNGKPFSKDYSFNITKYILNNNNLYHNLCLVNIENIILISAYGAGDSLKKSNLGIKIMNNWYLNDVYNNKNKQEKYLKDFTKNTNINLKIFRPNVLAYGDNIINAKTRKDLATEIINLIF
tara:strand:+ start:50 stop:697 length:648 start_codon:yes stop_codon:yes gene_type:complete